MKRTVILLGALLLCLCLTACSHKLPEPKSEEELAAELPEEFLSVTLEGEELPVDSVELTVTDRNIDLDRQTDDISCQVTLVGTDFSLSYSCDLHYAYVRESGWEIRSYELTNEPGLLLDETTYLAQLDTANRQRLEEESLTDLTLTTESWQDVTGSYTQTYSVSRSQTYLEEWGTIRTSGTLTRQGSGFQYVWSRDEDQVELDYVPINLVGTYWHFCSPDSRVEAAFQITGEEDGAFTLSGVIRSENWTGYIKEKTLDSQGTWSISEYGSISFPLTNLKGEELTCNIQSDRQWVNLDELYISALEPVDLPESGDLSDLMELPIESWTDKLTQESTTPEEDPAPDSGEEDTPEEELPQDYDEKEDSDSGISFWDLLWAIFAT
jgi:hypothetical protein